MLKKLIAYLNERQGEIVDWVDVTLALNGGHYYTRGTVYLYLNRLKNAGYLSSERGSSKFEILKPIPNLSSAELVA